MEKLIDLLVEAAKELGADKHPVALSTIENKTLELDKGKDYKRSSFSATLNYHTINMQSRFPEPNNIKKLTTWLNNPKFFKVNTGSYMLLSDEDKDIFDIAKEKNLEIIYKSEFDLKDLKNEVCKTLGNKTSESSLENMVLNEDYILKLLKLKKQIILYGPPGTGKTYNTNKIAIKIINLNMR